MMYRSTLFVQLNFYYNELFFDTRKTHENKDKKKKKELTYWRCKYTTKMERRKNSTFVLFGDIVLYMLKVYNRNT